MTKAGVRIEIKLALAADVLRKKRKIGLPCQVSAGRLTYPTASPPTVHAMRPERKNLLAARRRASVTILGERYVLNESVDLKISLSGPAVLCAIATKEALSAGNEMGPVMVSK